MPITDINPYLLQTYYGILLGSIMTNTT